MRATSVPHRGAPDTIKVAEAADRLGMSPRSVYKLIESGELPGGLRLGRRSVVRRIPFEDWLSSDLSVKAWRESIATPERNSRGAHYLDI